MAPTRLLLGLITCAALACAPRPMDPPTAYDTLCARCHAPDGTGDPRLMAEGHKLNLRESPMLARGDLAQVEQRIADGHGAMPGFVTKLRPEDLRALARYTVDRFAPTPPAKEAPDGPSALP